MRKVQYELISEEGRFQVADADGNEVVVEAGSTYSTDDPVVIAELDQASHAVRRVKAKSKEE